MNLAGLFCPETRGMLCHHFSASHLFQSIVPFLFCQFGPVLLLAVSKNVKTLSFERVLNEISITAFGAGS